MLLKGTFLKNELQHSGTLFSWTFPSPKYGGLKVETHNNLQYMFVTALQEKKMYNWSSKSEATLTFSRQVCRHG